MGGVVLGDGGGDGGILGVMVCDPISLLARNGSIILRKYLRRRYHVGLI